MSHRVPSDALLDLLSQKATYQAVRRLAAAPSGATRAQLRRAIDGDPRRVLQALAVEGFVARDGTWDLPPDDWSTFTLTISGHHLLAQMDRLDEWARTRETRRHRRRTVTGDDDQTRP